jgi:hypothetical protein
MVIPFAGPLLAARNRPAYDRPSSLWPYAAWSLAEVAGATMMVVGLIGRDVPERRAARPRARVSLFPVVTRQLGALSVNVTW